MELGFLLVYILLFAFGAMIGSFINVVIYRSLSEEPVKKKESWVTGRSRCDHCHRQIAWYDNIPLLSYAVLGGKCRYCHSPIDVTHLVVEVMMGILFVWWFWASSTIFHLTETPFQLIQPLFWLFVGVLLVAITCADWIYLIIPDTAVAMLVVMTFLYRVGLVLARIMQPQDLIWTVVSGVVLVGLFGLLWLGTKGRGFGFGDVKLILPLALLVGWPNSLVMVMTAFILGSIGGIALVVSGRRKWRQPVPFGPFLILGTVIALLWGNLVLQWYLRLFRV